MDANTKGLNGELKAFLMTFFLSASDSLFSPFVNAKKTKVFQLWHGIGAKAMKWEKLDKREVERFDRYTWLATSPAYIDILHDATRADKEKFIVTGYPRNDRNCNIKDI